MPIVWTLIGLSLTGSSGPEHPRVIIIGLDAASMNIVGPLAKAGLVPNLAGLIDQGAHGDFASLWPMRTPQIWTTVVTGKYPGQHRIWDHYANTRYNPPKYRTASKKVLTTSHRKSKALWNILDQRNIRVLSVGWIASWPAEALQHSVMLAPIVLANPNRQVSIKGTFWKDQKQQVHPASLWPRVQNLIVEGPTLVAADVSELADLPPADHPMLALPYLRSYIKAIKWSAARARTVEALTLEFLGDARPDLLMFYFQCSDSLLHRFWVFQKTEEEIAERFRTHSIPTDHVPELKRRFGRVAQACYQDMDARIGRILKAARGPNSLVLVISDHGFGEAPFPHPKKTEPYGGNHRDKGLIIASAPWLKKGSSLEGVTVLDIAPTLLHFFGLPVGRDMPGKVVEAILDPTSRGRAPEKVPSYEKKPQTKIPYRNGWPARKFRPLAEDR